MTNIDERVEVEFDIDDATFLKIAKLAHEEDITFNDMCNKILSEEIERLQDEVKTANEEKPSNSKGTTSSVSSCSSSPNS